MHVSGCSFPVRCHLYKWKSHYRIDADGKFLEHQFFPKNLRRERRFYARSIGASITCSNDIGKDPYVLSNVKISDARLIYAVAPAMGHNQVYNCFVSHLMLNNIIQGEYTKSLFCKLSQGFQIHPSN